MQNVPELWAPTYWLIQQRERGCVASLAVAFGASGRC